MKKINTSFVVDPSIQQPFTVKSLDFLHGGNKQMIEALCIAMIESRGVTYSTSVPYKLVDNAPTYSYIFFNGELYYFNEDVVAFPLVAVLDTAADGTADPLQFSDGVNRSVHDNRILKRSPNALGTGVFDLNTIVDLSTPYIQSSTTVSSFGSGWSTFTTVKYRKLNPSNQSGGLLMLQGSAQKATSPAGAIFTLPAGYIPSVDVYVPCVYDLDGTRTPNLLWIDSATGNVWLNSGGTGTLCIVYFDGIQIIL
jgi:hypothetical protein